jgi:hypothetical protein
VLEADRRPDDVDDRVDRTDLVEGDVVGRHAVNPAFGDGEGVEDPLRARADAGRERAPREELPDLRVVTMRVGPGSSVPVLRGRPGAVVVRVGRIGVDVHAELPSSDPRADALAELEPVTLQAERLEAALDGGERHARIDQRADRHAPAIPENGSK